MLRAARAFFAPPAFADEETTRSARTIYALALTVACFLLVATPAFVLSARTPLEAAASLIIDGGWVLITPLFLMLVRRGHVALVGAIYSALVYCATLYFALSFSYDISSSSVLFLGAIIVAAMLLGERGVLIFGPLSLLGQIAKILLSAPAERQLYAPSLSLFLIVMLGLMLWVIMRGLSAALRRERAAKQQVVERNAALEAEVAERRQIEEQLRASEQQIRLINAQLEQRVHERTSQLESANAELANFAYVASHDLKAPLRAISQLSTWIAEDYRDRLDDEGRGQLAMLVERTRHMHNLIDGILQYSRIGRTNERLTPVDLAQLAHDVVRMLAPPPQIAVTVGELPTVVGEPAMVTQVLQNLLSNAIRYADKPGGTICVSHTRAGAMWQIQVRDNGPGIEERYFQKIFQMFQTLGTRRDGDGTGIGLALVKRAVEKWGGSVWVESRPGEGAAFFFTMPAERSEE